MNRMIIKTERVVSVATTTFEAPYWMQLAFNGEKINAIKALREVVRRNMDGHLLGLGEAKDIVDSVCAGIRTDVTQV